MIKQMTNNFDDNLDKRLVEQEIIFDSIPAWIYYKDREIGSRRVDFLVDQDILVELKAIPKLEDVHFAQAINYIEAYKVMICLLINFNYQWKK